MRPVEDRLRKAISDRKEVMLNLKSLESQKINSTNSIRYSKNNIVMEEKNLAGVESLIVDESQKLLRLDTQIPLLHSEQEKEDKKKIAAKEKEKLLKKIALLEEREGEREYSKQGGWDSEDL